MATILPASSFSQTSSIVGQAYVFAAEEIRQELTEELNVLDAGIVVGVGDLVGSGSDTIRLTRFGGLGYAEQMQAMTSETEAIVPSSFTLNSDSVTIGRYGLAKEQTYTDAILGRAEAVGLEDMVALAPKSWLATLRANAATIGSTFSSSVSATGVAWSMDHEIALVAAFHETPGYTSALSPITLRHPEAFTDLRNSLRNEPSFQSPEVMQKLIGLSGDAQGAFSFLGFRNFASHDVPTSAGDHVGCAFVPGAIAWVVASTLPVPVANPATTTWVPEFGIVIERKSAGNVATAAFDMNAFFGMAKRSATQFPQFKLLSAND